MNQTEQVFASRVRLNEMMANADVTARLNIPDSLIFIDRSLDWNQLEEQTLAANAQLLASQSDRTIAELDLRSIRSRNYPWVDLNTGYGYRWNGYGAGETRLRSTLGPSAGLTVGYTLFDGNRRREQRNARIGIDNARLRSEELELNLRADLSDFWHAYQNFLRILSIEEQNVIAARELLEAARERYLFGDLSGFEMREAQQSLQEAEERILTTRYNTKMCEISLRQISGNVLSYLNE
jgi:outer membrane protein TolC